MGLKDMLVEEGMRIAGHPAVASVVQDPRFMRLVVMALEVPGKLGELSEEQRLAWLRMLGGAEKREVDDLKRAVRSLEDEIARLRSKLSRIDASENSDGGEAGSSDW